MVEAFQAEVPCAPIRWLPYPLAPPGLSVGSAGKIEDRGSEKSEKKSSQNWACLAWKFLVELVGVFCTYLGAPNRHIAKNPTNPKIYRTNIQNYDSAYLLPIFPVWSQPMGAHGILSPVAMATQPRTASPRSLAVTALTPAV